MVQQRRNVRNLKVGDHGYVAGIVDYAASEEQRNNAALGYTADEWKGLIGNGKHYPLRLDHGEDVGQLVQSSVDDQNQLWVHALFDLNSDLGRQTWERVKSKELHSFSIGFDARQTVHFNQEGAPKRYVLDFQEVSVTDNPRKEHAKILYRASQTAGELALPEGTSEVPAPPPPAEAAAPPDAPCADPTPTPAPVAEAAPTECAPPEVVAPPAPQPMQLDAPADAPQSGVIEPPQLLEAGAPQNAFITTATEHRVVAAEMSTPQDNAPMAVDAPAPATSSSSSAAPAAAPQQMQVPVPAPSLAEQVPASATVNLLKQELEAARAMREELAAAQAERKELAEIKLKKQQKAEERRAKAHAERQERMKQNAAVYAQYQQSAGLDDAQAEALQQEMLNNEVGGRFMDSYAAMAARIKAMEEEKAAQALELEAYKSLPMGDKKRVASANAPAATAEKVKSLIDWDNLPRRAAELAAQQRAANPSPALAALDSVRDGQLALATSRMDAMLRDQGLAAQAQAAVAAQAADEDEVPVEYEMLRNAQTPDEYYDVLYRMKIKGIMPEQIVRCSGTNKTLQDAELELATKTPEMQTLPEDRMCPLVAEALFGKFSSYIDQMVADQTRFESGREMTGIRFGKIEKNYDTQRDLALRQHQAALMRQQVMAQGRQNPFYQ